MWSRLSKANACNLWLWGVCCGLFCGLSGRAWCQQLSPAHAPTAAAVYPQDANAAVISSPAGSSPDYSSHEIAQRILQQSILQSVWGPPVHCVVRQSIHLYGKQLSGIGDYVRGGLGSGKLKYSMRMAAGDQLNSLLQVSDGQRLLSIESIGNVQRRTEIDLGKVRRPLVVTSDSIRDPVIAMYLAIGGQAELLRKIYQQYHWEVVREGELSQAEVWWLAGRLPPPPDQTRPTAFTDNQLMYDNNSGLLPTRIEVAVGKGNAAVPFWLYQIVQQRTAAELSPQARAEDIQILTEWSAPTLLTNVPIPPSMFELPSSNEQLFDETDKYLPPDIKLASFPTSSPALRSAPRIPAEIR